MKQSVNSAILMFGFMFGLYGNTASGQSIQHLEIGIGETKPVPFPKDRSTILSRENVIDLVFDKTSGWLATGLKSGIVVISDPDQELKIYVRSKPVEATKKNPNQTSPVGFQDWSTICNWPEVRCKGRQVSGSVSPRQAWFIRKQCLSQWCIDKTSVESDKEEAELQRIRAHPEVYSVDLNAWGFPLIHLICNENKKVPESVTTLLPESMFDRTCYTPAYEIQTTVGSLDTLANESKGFSQAPFSIGTHSFKENPASFVDHASTESGSSNAMPRVITSAFAEAKISSGIQLRVQSQNESGDVVEIPSGYESSFRVVPISDTSVRLTYEIKLSRNKSSLTTSNQSLTGTIALPLNETTTLGEVKLKIEKEQASFSLLLESIPIIGPLFKRQDLSIGDVDFKVSVRIQKL